MPTRRRPADVDPVDPVDRDGQLVDAALRRGRRRRLRRRVAGTLASLVVVSGMAGYWAETDGPLRCSTSGGQVQGRVDALFGWMLPDGQVGRAERGSCGEEWESGLGGD